MSDESTQRDEEAAPPTASLSIGAVAELTGVSVPTLRAWETRHGFPAPRRGAGGAHRRYAHADVEAIIHVVEARRAGYALDAAIAAVRDAPRAEAAARSIYAAVRARWPGIAAHAISRTTMLSISRAIEDECCARALDGLLIAAFQSPAAYEPARARWKEFARTASGAVVLADFDRSVHRRHGPIEIALDPRSPVLREWAVICDAPGSSACLVGWEHPDPRGRSDRPFEALWTVDAAVTRTAARAALAIAASHGTDRAMPSAPVVTGPIQPIDPDRLVALTGRIVANLDRALEGRR